MNREAKQMDENRTSKDPRISTKNLEYCSKCGGEISRKWNYCPNCGAAVPHQKSEEK